MIDGQRVFLVDDDASVRDAVRVFLEVSHVPVEVFSSAEDFLSELSPDWTGCVLLDLRMGGIDGLQAQQELQRRGIAMPVVIMTAYGDVATVRAALKAGAHDFLEKPVDNAVLLDVVRTLFALDVQRRQEHAQQDQARQTLSRLTVREREVMAHLVAGRQHREIAELLGISPRTVEVYKARMMEKLGARSLADVIHFESRAGTDGA